MIDWMFEVRSQVLSILLEIVMLSTHQHKRSTERERALRGRSVASVASVISESVFTAIFWQPIMKDNNFAIGRLTHNV